MKRLFDFVVSLLLIIALLPFFIFFCIIITIDDFGNPFYTQSRVGLNNRNFNLFKFRTMYKNSDKGGLITVGNDKRITHFGYFLRKYKLDELPQLFNVLIGDMSLVGPRPEVRKYVDLYTEKQLKVLAVKPGITDYASILYKDESTLLQNSPNPLKTYTEEVMPHKLLLNLKYIEEMSFKTDLKIIFQTVKAILTKT